MVFTAISRAGGVNFGLTCFTGSAVMGFSWCRFWPFRVSALIVVRRCRLLVRAVRERRYLMLLENAHKGYKYEL